MPNSEQNGVDFDLKYRPATIDDVVGQPQAVAALRGFGGPFPRALRFAGPPGTGKTTLARAVIRQAGVSDIDCQEKNCGVVESAIDLVRSINSEMTGSPMMGSKRAWVLDEVQTFSRTKFAQEALLKILEDGPPHVMFILCTTDPKRLLPAIRTRCTPITLNPVPDADLAVLLKRIAKAERIVLEQKVLDRLVAHAGGCARNAVKSLQKIAGIVGADAQLAAIGPDLTDGTDPFGLVRELMPWKGQPNWKAAAKILGEIKDEEPEGIRMMLLASARAMLLKGGENAPLASRVIRYLAEPLYDRTSGHALLANACWLACTATK